MKTKQYPLLLLAITLGLISCNPVTSFEREVINAELSLEDGGESGLSDDKDGFEEQQDIKFDSEQWNFQLARFDGIDVGDKDIIVHFEVDDGDIIQNGKDNDPNNPKNRAEIAQKELFSDLNQQGTTHEYSYEMRIPSSFAYFSNNQLFWTVLAQFKQPFEGSPPIALKMERFENQRPYLYLQLRDGNTMQVSKIAEWYPPLDQWFHIRLQIKWSYTNEGFIRVLVDDRLIAQRERVNTMYTAEPNYWKLGLYRTARLKGKFEIDLKNIRWKEL